MLMQMIRTTDFSTSLCLVLPRLVDLVLLLLLEVSEAVSCSQLTRTFVETFKNPTISCELETLRLSFVVWLSAIAC